MDGTVRDLLYLRGVRLSPSEGLPEIIGFRCLGMAEKIPDILGETGALVHIWHVSSEMLPVSAAELMHADPTIKTVLQGVYVFETNHLTNEFSPMFEDALH